MNGEENTKTIPKSVRITTEHEKYLLENKLSLSQITKDAIESKKQGDKQTKKQNKQNVISQNIVIVALGVMFFWIVTISSNPMQQFVLLLLGLFMVCLGIFGLHEAVKKNDAK